MNQTPESESPEPEPDMEPQSPGDPVSELLDDIAAVSHDPQEDAGAPGSKGPDGPPAERTLDPPKLIRLANLAREVLEEVRQLEPEDSTVQDLAALYRRVEDQLKDAMPQVLAEELDSMELAMPFRDAASQAEVRLAYSGLIGWLGGLFQGLHASLLAAGPVLELGSPGARPGGMPPGAMPSGQGHGGRPGLEPPGSQIDPKKGEGYL